MNAILLVRTTVRAAVNRHRRTNVPNDLSMEVSAEIARDIAKRKAELQTVLTRTMDFGDLGEVEVEIEYDADPGTRGCWDTPATAGWFHFTSIYRKDDPTRTDCLPVLTILVGKEAIDAAADFIAAELRYEARKEEE